MSQKSSEDYDFNSIKTRVCEELKHIIWGNIGLFITFLGLILYEYTLYAKYWNPEINSLAIANDINKYAMSIIVLIVFQNVHWISRIRKLLLKTKDQDEC